MAEVNRLPADAPHNFGGLDLDRAKPLTFRLDGREVSAFAGDTVLTALLANGIVAAGTHAGSPLALDERLALLVRLRSDANAVVPMDRIPALSGLDLVTLGNGHAARGPLSRLLGRFRTDPNALGQQFDDLKPAPWLEQPPEATLQVDTLIVGGGLAGLSAAAAAEGRTLLLERRAWLGGDARYFGTTGDEEPPASAIARLSSSLTAEVLLRTEVFALSGTTAKAHQVLVQDGKVSTRVIAIEAKRVVLATGAFERTSLFCGNRLPGVVGAIAAFHRADRYGVWPGKRALFSAPGGHGYRLALLAKDAGVTVQRVADTRLGPNSRFIDFCKASGVSFASGLVPRSAALSGKKHTGLSVGFAVAIAEIKQDTALIETDQFVAAGALHPDLSLWLQVGGATEWNGGWLEARGAMPGVTLAGSAAGYRGSAACMASGRAAVNGSSEIIPDPEIEAIYESPDGPNPMAPHADAHLPTYLDGGNGLAIRPADAAQLAHPRSLSIGELAAAVQIGAILPALAGRVAADRCVAGGDIVDSGWRVQPPPPSAELPAYLRGRFGQKPQLCVITSADARYFERGCLVFTASALTDPSMAIGTIVGPAPGGGIGGLALIEREASKGETRLFVRDSGGAVPIERLERMKT